MKNIKRILSNKIIERIITRALMPLALIGAAAAGVLAAPPPNDNFASAESLAGIQVHVTRTNVQATKEAGEPDHAFNAGGRSVWFKWTAPMTRVMTVTTNRSVTNIDTNIHLYTGATLATLSGVAFALDIDAPANRRSLLRFVATAGVTYYLAVDGNNDGQTVAEGSFALDIQPGFVHQSADYDADGTADPALFRPTTGTWLVAGSTRQFTRQFGAPGDRPVVATRAQNNEITVFRPSTGTWFRNVCCGQLYSYWGTSGDLPVPEAFGGDAASEYAVYRPAEGLWYIYGHGGGDLYYRFGLGTDVPVPGHYSADSFADIAVFRPSNGVWYFVVRSGSIGALDQFRAVQFGQPGDKPVPGDYDGDGLLDIAVYRPGTGTWWVLRSSDNQATAFRWGVAEDIPATGDFDGDGRFDYAVYRPSNATWYIFRSGDAALRIVPLGQPGDVPVANNVNF